VGKGQPHLLLLFWVSEELILLAVSDFELIADSNSPYNLFDK
jgi:hypothetical protein